jgi:hypothetical protein
MAWAATPTSASTGSHLQAKTLVDILALNYTTSLAVVPDLNSTTTIKAALYDNTVTPDAAATGSSAGYAGTGSPWVSTGGSTGAAQVFQTGSTAGDWIQGGRLISSGISFSASANASGALLTWAPSLPMANSTATTLSNIYGMFLYFTNTDTSGGGIANSGLGFWFFGGTAYGVTSGVLTVTSSASGLFTLQV